MIYSKGDFVELHVRIGTIGKVVDTNEEFDTVTVRYKDGKQITALADEVKNFVARADEVEKIRKNATQSVIRQIAKARHRAIKMVETRLGCGSRQARALVDRRLYDADYIASKAVEVG